MVKKQHLKTRDTCKVTFELPADFNAKAGAVHLLAEFNDWQEKPFKQLKSGKWQITEEVAPGRSYQFRYHVFENGHDYYLNDEDADHIAANDQGTENAVISC